MQDNIQLRKFTSGGKQYLLQLCKWKSINLDTKAVFPSKRYSHSSCILDGYLYIFGGAKSINQKQNVCLVDTQVMYVLNLKTMNWSCVKNDSIPQNRDSYGCVTHQNSIYIFGGSINLQHNYNDLISFSPLEDKWVVINTKDSPSPRQLPIFISINDEFLFLYAGINIKQEQICEDAYIFKNQNWFKMKIINAPQPRIGMNVAVCGKKVYMFGGEGPDLNCLFFDDLYTLEIDQLKLELKFKKVIPKSQNNPVGRAYHGMSALSKKYLIVIGGETQQLKQTHSKRQSKTLNDIWVFDTIEIMWIMIEPKNGTLKPFHSFSMSVNANKIYMFGGMKNQNLILGEMICLTFAEDQLSETVICSQCIEVESKQKQIQFNLPFQPKVSIGFLYNLSLQIKHPFHAIGIIIDSISQMNASYFRVETNSQIGLIQLTFDGQFLNSQQFGAFISHRYINDKVKRISNGLKLGSLRLGKTVLMVSADNQTRRVYLISANSVLTPKLEQQLIFYYYCQDIRTGVIKDYKGCAMKQFVINMLSSYVDDPAQILNIKNCNKIYIYSANCIMILQKLYYYQLISYTEYDIRMYRNPKLLQFMYNELKLDIYSNPQISLSSFLCIYHLYPNIKFYINSVKQPIEMISYLGVINKYINTNKILNLQYPNQPINGLSYTAQIYQPKQNQYLSQNYGILIYFNNRFINRFQCKFGGMFKQKFYKTKFKKIQQNIFNYLVQPNILMNEFIKNNTYITLARNLNKFLDRLKDTKQQPKDQQHRQQLVKKIKI